MKVARTYTIDVENVKLLEAVDNASQLIDDLLTHHFEREAQPKVDDPKQKILDKYDLPKEIKEWVRKLDNRPQPLTIMNAYKAYKLPMKPTSRTTVCELWEALNGAN